MRLGVIDGRARLLRGDRALDINTATDGRLPSDPTELYDRWNDLVAWAPSASFEAAEPFSADRLQNPVPRPRQVFAIGANYRDHIEEAGATVPEFPLIFTKFSECLVGPNAEIPIPSQRVDWEVELVVVMGRRAHRVAADEAWDYVAGLTVGQDVSERAVQLSGKNPQFSMGKSFPGFGPLGPVVVTPDEVDDPNDLELGCRLNGEVVQHSRTSELVFSIAELIAYISNICPLVPGDLVFTGTPSGVGAFMNPRRFLQPGDVIESWVEGIGELRNTAVDAVPFRKAQR